MPEATSLPGAVALVLLALSATAAGAFGAAFGLGAGVLLSFAVSAVYGVDAVVPMITAAMLVANAGRIVAYRGAVQGRTLAVALSAAAPAAAAGAQVQATLPGWAVAGAIGAILIASIPVGRAARARDIRLSSVALAALSAVLGFVGSLGIGAGALAIPVLLGAGLAGPALIATDAALAVGTSIVRTGTFALLGVLTPERLITAFAIGAATLPGAWFGARLVRRAGLRRHALAVEGFALVAGLLYLWEALRLV